MRRINSIPFDDYVKRLKDLKITPEQEVKDIKKEIVDNMDYFEDPLFYKSISGMLEKFDGANDFEICDKILYIESELWTHILRNRKKNTLDSTIELKLLHWIYNEINTVWLRLLRFEDYRRVKDEGQNYNT